MIAHGHMAVFLLCPGRKIDAMVNSNPHTFMKICPAHIAFDLGWQPHSVTRLSPSMQAIQVHSPSHILPLGQG